ncbi:hypothetical protein CQ018_12580 [Arthrobacter sp. MYb227]|uniref:thermonuclease family protein n=1 Tax=Arthrobacter sp. MYb227 TaxID=1848601 RepID=UPI000CFBD90D|nr:thermonuclease family protein [Arthrobacter sp. MYb227]PQZ92331.1 hypothetical protein CQ018_12580 [Arthrobacter sp. MYb227]
MFGGTNKVVAAKRKLGAAIATVMSFGLVMTACTAVPAPSKNSDESAATVVRIIDGDTIVADISGTDTTVRLLNIDTPETKHPDKPVECLGQEATDFTESLLAPGDKVTLAYGIERLDPYGRTLAGVYKDEKLVNAQIAAAGLGVAVLFQPNERFYAEVKAAEEAAQTAATGLFSQAIACTVPATVAGALADFDEVEDADPTSAVAAGSALGVAAAAILAGKAKNAALKSLHEGESTVAAGIWAARRGAAQPKLDAALKRATDIEVKLTRSQSTLAASEKAAKEAAAAQKVQEEKAKQEKIVAEQKAAELKEQQKIQAEQQAKAKRQSAAAHAAKAEAQRKAAAKKKAAAPKKKNVVPKKTYKAPAKKRAPKKSGGSYSGYTGPRCYAPGGKSWKPCG